MEEGRGGHEEGRGGRVDGRTTVDGSSFAARSRIDEPTVDRSGATGMTADVG
jgi:hypothetical protein